MALMGGKMLKRAINMARSANPGREIAGGSAPGSMQYTGIDPYRRTSGMDISRRQMKKKRGVRRRGKEGGLGPDQTQR